MGRRWLKVASDVTSGSAAVTSCERRDIGQGGDCESPDNVEQGGDCESPDNRQGSGDGQQAT